MTEIRKQVTEQIKSGKLLITQTRNGWLLTKDPQEDDAPAVASTYKDRIFRMIFDDRKELLMLYNAMNGTHYDKPEDLSVTTLENAIYMSMKNLFYVSDIYSSLTKDKNIYGSSMIRIPEPRFVVFYNGLDHVPEQSTLRLSDMYENPSGEVSLELVTQVFNVNLGYNKVLMDNCETLHGYAVFVDLVRRYQKAEYTLKAAIAKAINKCIENGILADFLKANKAEVLKMSIYEYDEAKHIQLERKEAKEEGWQDGLAKGRQEGIKNLIETCQDLNASEDDTLQRIMQKYSLSKDDAQKYITQYWKVTV